MAPMDTDMHPGIGRVLLVTAVAFLMAGLVNVAMPFTPARFGDPAWELAAFSEVAVSLGGFTIGFGGLIILAGLGGYSRTNLFLGVAGAVLAVGCLVGGLVVATNVPFVWQAVAGGGAPRALKVATVKAIGLLGVYALALLALTVYSVRFSFKSR